MAKPDDQELLEQALEYLAEIDLATVVNRSVPASKFILTDYIYRNMVGAFGYGPVERALEEARRIRSVIT